MANFDIRRFGLVLRWMAVSMRKEVLSNTGAMFFAYTIIFVTNMLSSRHVDYEAAKGILYAAVSLNTIVFVVVCMIGGCWIMNNMRTKEQRVMFMTLPASDLEKFAARALYVTVGWVLMAFVAYCLADVFRMLMSVVTGVYVVRCTIPEFLSTIFGSHGLVSVVAFGWSPDTVKMVAAFCAWLFFVHSIYVLGGVFFRRRQFVLTSCYCFALGVVSTMVVFTMLDRSVPIVTNDNFGAWALSAALLFALWGAADWWLAYRLFRRMQVINNKWINL